MVSDLFVGSLFGLVGYQVGLCREGSRRDERVRCLLHTQVGSNRIAAGLLRERVQHRYAQYCKVVRERLLIDQ